MRRAAAFLSAALMVLAAGGGLFPVGSAFAQGRAPTMTVEGTWGPVALVRVRLEESRYVDIYADPDWGCDQPDIICHYGSMQEAFGRISRLYARSEGFRPNLMRFRRPGGHARRSIPGGSFLAVIEWTETGYYWMPGLKKTRSGLPACRHLSSTSSRSYFRNMRVR